MVKEKSAKSGVKVSESNEGTEEFENRKGKVFANMYIGKKDSSKTNKFSP